MTQTERTELRLRISNLEAVALTYAADFVIRRDASYAGAPELEARPAHGIVASGLGLPNLLGMPQFAADPWRLTGELWIMTVRFTVASGATESIAVYPWSRGMNVYMVPRTHQGYVILRLPSRRDPRRPLRRLPQLERPARVLLAAEAVLTQEEWPPRDQRFLGYAPPKSLIEPSREPVFAPATRPASQIVEALPLATGRAEIELAPEGADVVERVEVERTGAQLVDRLERGEAVRGAEGLDATDRLAGFLDEIASLGDDPNAVGAMNAFLAQQGSRLQLSAAPDPNAPRRRRPRR